MTIYTTYFAKLKQLPKNIIPISICAKCPAGFKGMQYKKLAPNYNILMQWKNDNNCERYINEYNTSILSKLNVDEIVDDLYSLSGAKNKGFDIALVCYEKAEDFCHRHLVADWLNKHGYQAEEYKSSNV